MKKNGFTLIELLAVILILGIIALIAISTVNEVIEDSKKGALKNSADNIITAAEQQCTVEIMRGDNITKSYSINDGIISSNLNIKNLPENGTINLDNDCNATAAITDGKYCVIKDGEKTIINSNTNNCTLDYVATPDTESSCFIFDESTRTITGYDFSNTSCPTAIVIPDTINNIPVENIGDFAFVNMGEYIPIYSMLDDSNSLNYQDIKIENASIYGLSLNVIRLIKINTNAKKNCYKKDSLNSDFLEEDINYIGSSSDEYRGCSIYDYTVANSLGDITLVDFTKANNLKTIGDGAFMNNKISTVYFDTNNSFEYIGNSIFSDNVLTGTVNLSGFNYTKIPNAMFSSNSINKVIYSDKIETIGAYAFFMNSLIDYNLPSSLINIESAAFYANNYNTGNTVPVLTIPDSVISIGALAFSANEINKVVLGKGVKALKHGAFNSSKISIIELNEGLEDIGPWVFAYNKITKIELPESIKNLGGACFNNNAVTSQANGAFIEKIENGIKYPKNLISVAAVTNAQITLNTITTLSKEALQNVNFYSLKLPDIITIEDGAVAHNYMRGAIITIGPSVTSIAPDAFACEEKSYCNHTITIDSSYTENEPWGNPYATITHISTE